MHEYQICVEGASTACKPDEGVFAWREVEMYICQLLIPAIREHEQCFSAGRNSRCNMKYVRRRVDNSCFFSDSIPWRLLSVVSSHPSPRMSTASNNTTKSAPKQPWRCFPRFRRRVYILWMPSGAEWDRPFPPPQPPQKNQKNQKKRSKKRRRLAIVRETGITVLLGYCQARHFGHKSPDHRDDCGRGAGNHYCG